MSAPHDCFKILVASDIHVGYAEKDPIRGNDSFNSFEEVLQIAHKQKVDMVLLGGDLFHDNKPSPGCLIRSTEILRKYCLGDGAVQFQLVSNQKENFKHTKLFPYVNFEEENLNVSMPVFSIHGNHDDPTGKNPVCYLEALSASGLINYFGKHTNVEKIEVSPLLLTKGCTKLALFGLGSLPEERLHRFFLHKKVKFMRPAEDRNEWFNILVVHQNRVPHGTKYLPERFLGKLPDLVVWGHEHESKTTLDHNTEMDFYVLQPGSTVATSLCPGEAEPKHVALLEIWHDKRSNLPKMSHEAIPLRTVRPFYFDSFDLDEVLGNANRDAETVEDFCNRKVQALIDKAEIDHTGDPIQPKLPLIRLRIESSCELPFSIYAFGLKFKDKVANNSDLLLFKLKRKTRAKLGEVEIDKEKLESMLNGENETFANIEDIVEELLIDPNGKTKPLEMLSERQLTTAVREMVEKDTPDAVETILDTMLGKTRCRLTEMDFDLSSSVDKASLLDDAETISKEVKAIRKDLRSKEMNDKKLVTENISQQASQRSPVSTPPVQKKRKIKAKQKDLSDDEIEIESEGDSPMQVDDDIEEVTYDSDEEEERRALAKASAKRGTRSRK